MRFLKNTGYPAYLLCGIVLLILLACSSEKPPETRNQKHEDRGNTRVFETAQLPIPDNKTMKSSEVNREKASKETIASRNIPPQISKVRILPEDVFKPGDTLSVDASGSDIDGDEVTIFYEWIKNGEPAGNDKQITEPLKRGDKVSIKVTPFDGEDYGHPLVFHREILNLPPMIIEHKKANFDGNLYTHQMEATDPDGDTLTYSLNEAPDGMDIDKATGLITWEVEGKHTGRHTVHVQVSDGHGGKSSYHLNVTIGIEPSSQKGE